MKNILCITLLFCLHVTAQKQARLASPDGNIVFNFKMEKGQPFYNVSYKKQTIIQNSALGYSFKGADFTKNITAGKAVTSDSIEDYTLVVGKTKHVHDAYRQLIVPLAKNNYSINLIVRAFNDGVAFRYHFLHAGNDSSLTITDEHSSFAMDSSTMLHTLLRANYTTSHEGYYTITSLGSLQADTLMDMPVLFQLPNKIYAAITEAALLDYAGMYLSKHDGVLVSKLSPLPSELPPPSVGGKIKVIAGLPHVSPWRVIMISDRLGALTESNIITSLNAPCKIKDVSWLKPGKTTFPWWNGNVVPDTINAPGNNFVTNKYYIDFCARNNIQYHSVVEYGLHQWYTDDGVGFQPGPHNDVTKPVPGLDMKEICDYAKSKGVDVRVWVHFYALYPRLDSAFSIFEQWGLSGMMVDFMDRDDQQMVNMQTEILEKAAQHHLHIQFHGAYKPTGLSRTYPNEFTREGTYNYETNKWNDHGLPPDHDLNIAFTRMLAGSTDYHMGGFRAVPDKDFRMQYTRPLMAGTRCHMLGMYVVLENYVQMVCDYPEAYEGQPGFEFVQQIPTTWDETKVPAAALDKYLVLARRSNNDWYVGGINNHEARTIQIPLQFLQDGNYKAELYTDAPDVATQPNHLSKQTKTYTAKDVVSIQLAAGGGFAMRLIKQ